MRAPKYTSNTAPKAKPLRDLASCFIEMVSNIDSYFTSCIPGTSPSRCAKIGISVADSDSSSTHSSLCSNSSIISLAMVMADRALSGVKSVIPVDEVITAMGAVGRSLPESLRETARGGLAVTPTGLALNKKIFGE